MQTRALPGNRPLQGDYGAYQGPVHPDGEPKMLPNHLEREKRRQEQDRYMPPETDEEETSGITRMYDLLWPITFWCITAINLMTLAAASFSMAGNYDVWKQLHVSAITLACITAMILIDKWVIRGPDGLPRFHKRQE